MAIFKKLLVSESSSPRRKISTEAIASPPVSPKDFSNANQGQKRHNSSSSSSLNGNPNSTNTSGSHQDLPTGLEELCWHLYSRPLRKEQIRLTVFSEKDSRLLYDSDTVVAVTDRVVTGSHRSQCGHFQFLPHKFDTPRISKMLFGTMPTSTRSDSLKIHTLRDANCVMMSRVFSIPKLNKYHSPFKSSELFKCMVGSLSSDSDSHSNYSTIRSIEGIRDRDDGINCLGKFPIISSRTFINPDPPENFVRVRNSSLQLDSNDMDDIMEELRAFSPNRLSRTRRRQLSQMGFEDNISIRLSNRSRLSSCSSTADGAPNDLMSSDWQQYGFALLIPVDFRPFIFQHILQVERELDRLVFHIHKAVQDKSQFFKFIHEGWSHICNSLCLLCNSLRLKNPVWLTLISSASERKEAAETIAMEFCQMLELLHKSLNTKENKFFLSTLLSAVLMNQLTWVASVAPPENCSYDRPLLLGTSIIDPNKMPYNPTIAQLLELYYGVGTANESERKFTKIVVVGDNSREIAHLLHVLSYFIRCSSVESCHHQEEFISSNNEKLHDFGRSLLAGVCIHYSPHFVLSGIQTTEDAFEDALMAIWEDVRHPMGEPCTNSQLMLTLSPSNSQTLATSNESGAGHRTPHFITNTKTEPFHDQLYQSNKRKSFTATDEGKSTPEKMPNNIQRQEEQNSNLVVLIDAMHHSVKIITANNCQLEDVPFICPSDAITSLLEEFSELYSSNCAPNFLLSFIEDKLGSLLAKSGVFVNLITTTEGKEPLSMERVSAILNCDCSDLRLILNIAAVYSPGILAAAL